MTDETIILDELPRRKPQNRPGRQQGSPGAQQGSLEEEQPLPERQQGVQGRSAGGGGLRGAGFSRGQERMGMGRGGGGPNIGRMPAIISAVLKPAQSFRLSGFTFRYGSATTHVENGGVHLLGTCPSARVDHCHFDQLYDNPFIQTHGQIYMWLTTVFLTKGQGH